MPSFSLQKTFGETLQKLGTKYKNFVVIDCDLNNSLNTLSFAKAFPERHILLNFQENTAIEIANGLASKGKQVFVCSKSTHLLNSLDKIKNLISYPNLNIKLIGADSGLSPAEEGHTQHCLNDIASISPLPNFKIFSPADSIQTKLITEFLVQDFGPSYLRLPSLPCPEIYDPAKPTFNFSSPDTIKQGEEVCIFTTGPIIIEVLKAATELDKKGITTKVINVSTISPLNNEQIEKLSEQSRLIITAEEHLRRGGLGSLIMESLNERKPKKIHQFALESLGESGRYPDLLKKYQLDSKGLYEQIKNLWFAL